MTPAYRFARAGTVYKELAAEDGHLIARMVRSGEIAANDDYWTPGLSEWKKVYSRSWDIPNPAATPAPTPTPAAATAAKSNPAVTSPAPARAVAPATTCECVACKKSFTEPAKAPSGYSVIGKAVKFFLYAVGVLILILIISGFLYAFSNPLSGSPNWVVMIITGLINTALFILAIGLFLMSIFELSSAAVTHGLYRFTPERCPHCNAATFLRK